MEAILSNCLMGDYDALQVWQVAAGVVRPLLQIDIVVEILVENVRGCRQWSLI